MDGKKRITKISSYDFDHIIAKVFCRWVIPFYKLCQYKRLEIEDLYKCSQEDESDIVVNHLEKNWNNQLKGENPNFAKAFIKTFASSLLFPFLFYTIEDCILKTIQPILLGMAVRYFCATIRDDNVFDSYLTGAGICLTVLLIINVQHPTSLTAMRASMRAKIGWSSLIYKKCLKLNRSSLGSATVGQIINLMTNDIRRFDEFFLVVSYLLIVPIQTILFTWIAWQYLGSACLATVAALMLFIPVMALIGRKVTQIRLKTTQFSDSRISLMNEVIRGIRVIKMYAWEQYFSQIGHQTRKEEMQQIKSASIVKAITLSLSLISGRLIMFISFVTYVLMGGKLTPESIFVSITLFERLRYSITWMFPQALSGGSEILVSCNRLQKFLLLDEIKPISTKSKNKDFNFKGILVKDLNSHFKSFNFSLKNISLEVKPGELLTIVGAVGSGKSSLLLSILGELDSISAEQFIIGGSVAYVSQEPYCFNGTIRQNILFGKSFDEKIYRQILYVCALEEDLKQLTDGDQTIIGERGVTLSGGQKARVNLARALYQNSDVYLLDDPLSAVDASVAKHIFEKCILEYLKHKSVILVTHQMQFIKEDSKILYLSDGECHGIGNFAELQKSGVDFVSFMKIHNESIENECHFKGLDEKYNTFDEKLIDNNQKPNNESKIEDELYESEDMNLKLYYDYFKSGSSFTLLAFALFSTLFTQFLLHFTDYWLTLWDGNEADSTNSGDDTKKIIIYSMISITLFAFSTIRSVTFYQICLKSSEIFHNRVFDRLLCTSMTVFDYMPIGRILNRFTRDIGILDDTLPMTLFDMNLALIQVMGVLLTVITVSPYMIIPALVYAIVLIRMRKFYVKPSQEMRKFEAITRSPIYSHVSTTLDGLTTVRAFNAQEMFVKQYFAYQDDHTSSWFLQCCTARAFGIAIDYIGFIYITAVTLTLFIFREDISENGAGLAFSSILTLTGMTQWAVKRTVDAEIYMTSVQRLQQYCNLPKEEDTESQTIKPPIDWPQNGEICIRNLSMTYPNTTKLVLNDINLKINSGEKLGIVGRTGAGKSSLINALFRLCKANGSIIIDGIDVKDIRLYDMRKKLSIIPQEPVVFSGSIRRNLDPYNENTDEDIWSVLEEVQLKRLIESLPNQMKTIISENVFNLSVGQKQLICLARALLRNNNILILDEATANVDYQTDQLIQKAIRSKCSKCTVITVAHRINTVIDCDRILVMEEGRVVDDGSPYLLLKQENSYFSKLVQQTGHRMATHLQESALQSFNTKNNFIKPINETILRQRNVF